MSYPSSRYNLTTPGFFSATCRYIHGLRMSRANSSAAAIIARPSPSPRSASVTVKSLRYPQSVGGDSDVNRRRVAPSKDTPTVATTGPYATLFSSDHELIGASSSSSSSQLEAASTPSAQSSFFLSDVRSLGARSRPTR